MLCEDVKAKARWLYGADTKDKIARAWFSDATLSMVLYRAMASCNRRRLSKPLAFVLQKLCSIICGAVFGINAKFGRRLLILHSVGVVVNSAVVAGDDVIIESGVVIGAEKGQSPNIGDRVFIGSGAKIIGGIRIGNDVTIGANAVIISDVPSDVVVGGIPAKIIRDKRIIQFS
jgi:serine O-acetyltransferase